MQTYLRIFGFFLIANLFLLLIAVPSIQESAAFHAATKTPPPYIAKRTSPPPPITPLPTQKILPRAL